MHVRYFALYNVFSSNGSYAANNFRKRLLQFPKAPISAILQIFKRYTILNRYLKIERIQMCMVIVIKRIFITYI
jgi:hypothetical protein